MPKSKNKISVGTPSGHEDPRDSSTKEGNQPGEKRMGRKKAQVSPPNMLVIGYDPAKSSEGGLAALYNGELIWCGRVLLWDIDEDEDLCAGFENIRDAWISLASMSPDMTQAHLFYERSQHGSHVSRAAVSEAGGAAFPLFKNIFYPKDQLTKRALSKARVLKDTTIASQRRHAIQPRDWRVVFDQDVNGLEAPELKAMSLAFAKKHYNYRGTNHNVSDSICMAHYGHMTLTANDPKRA